MKKIISFLLAICIFSSLSLYMTSCGIFGETIDNGTEIAKLLLAKERLDEKLVGSEIDIGLSSAANKKINDTTENEFQYEPRVKLLSNRVLSSPYDTASESSYTWTDFPATSPSMIEFSQFMESVDEEVKRVAEDIANMKENIGITDKWVEIGIEMHMLRVFENYDILFVKDEYNNFYVYYRYTDENAKNIYEMFSFMAYEDGTTGEIRTMLIPGERYEYMYNNSSGFYDYFIAENSRGYWMNTRFNYFYQEEANGQKYEKIQFSPYIIKDGLGYGSFITIEDFPDTEDYANSEQFNEDMKTEWYSIFDPESNRELFRISEKDMDYAFALYLSAIRDGFVSVSANEFDVYDSEGEISYYTNRLDTLTTKNGVYKSIMDYYDFPKNEFAWNSGTIQYDYSEHIYSGSLDFVMVEPKITIYKAFENFADYIKTFGLELYCDMENVTKSVEHASLLSDSFGESFEWNGYKMSSLENVRKGRAVLQSQFDNARADYEAVKDFEIAEGKQSMPRNASFAKIDTIVSDGNVFNGTSILLSGVSAVTDDVALFESGKEYVLKIGLSLLDENGNPISVNTIALPGAESDAVLFSESSIALTANGQYEIPKKLDRGSYAVVAYIATKDESIRLSEMKKIAFVSIEEGEIQSSAMHVEAINQENNLVIKYEIKNVHRIAAKANEKGLSYSEVEKIIMVEILSYGAPYHNAVLEYENGGEVDRNATLSKGTYRMICYLATSEGLVQSYVYLTLE